MLSVHDDCIINAMFAAVITIFAIKPSQNLLMYAEQNRGRIFVVCLGGRNTKYFIHDGGAYIYSSESQQQKPR